MSLPLAGGSTVGGVIDHSTREAEMRRITQSTFGIRLALMTSFISVVAVLLPLVALAGTGDPTGG